MHNYYRPISCLPSLLSFVKTTYRVLGKSILYRLWEQIKSTFLLLLFYFWFHSIFGWVFPFQAQEGAVQTTAWRVHWSTKEVLYKRMQSISAGSAVEEVRAKCTPMGNKVRITKIVRKPVIFFDEYYHDAYHLSYEVYLAIDTPNERSEKLTRKPTSGCTVGMLNFLFLIFQIIPT